MSLASLLQHDLVVHTYTEGVTDAEGNPVESYAPAIGAGSPITKGYVQRDSQAFEDRQAGQTVERKEWKAYLPTSATVTERDRITWQGRIFQIVAVYDIWGPRNNHHKRLELFETGLLDAS